MADQLMTYRATRDCDIVTNVAGEMTGPTRTMKAGTTFTSDGTVSTCTVEGRTFAYRPVIGKDGNVEGHVFVGGVLKVETRADAG